MEIISTAALTEAVARTPSEHYVVWTGRPMAGQAGSLRSRALACVFEVGSPVPLRVLLQRAARVDNGAGYNPDTVRSAVRLHQAAKPAVYLLVERRPSGEFVAVTDIPFAAGLERPVRAGDPILDRDGALMWDEAADA